MKTEAFLFWYCLHVLLVKDEGSFTVEEVGVRHCGFRDVMETR